MKASNLNLREDSIGKLFLKYSIPSAVGMMVYSIYVVIDGIFVGRVVGAEGLAAVNVAMPYFSLAFALSIMVGVGANTVVAIELGEGKIKKAQNTFNMAFFVLMAISMAITILTFIFLDDFARLLGANDNILPLVKDYIIVIGMFLPAFTGQGFLASALRAVEKPNLAMICNVSGSVLNVILDYIFIVELGLGVKGAALATGIAFTIAFFIGIIGFLQKDCILKFSRFDIQWKKIIRFLYNGSSEAITEITIAFTTFLFNIVLMNKLGDVGVSAFSIVSYITYLVTAIFIGISTGVAPIISFNYGAKESDRILQITKLTAKVMIGIGIIATCVLIFFGEALIELFAEGNLDLIDVTINACKIYAISFLFNGMNILGASYFTALEDAKTSVIISVLRGVVFIAIGIVLLPRIFGDNGIWMTVAFSEIITLVYTLRVMKKSREEVENLVPVELR